MIYSTLKRGPWKRKAPRPDSPKRAMYEARVKAAQASKARDKALTYGCEYAGWMRGWYRLNGCAACSRLDPRGPHLHHVVHKSRKGRAETLVPLCPGCHTEDGFGIEGNALRAFSVDLRVSAAGFAEVGKEQGWLPVEMCEAEGCGKWHSAPLMLDDVDQRTGITRRICRDCAPDGPI